jgi:hypothetical protein
VAVARRWRRRRSPVALVIRNRDAEISRRVTAHSGIAAFRRRHGTGLVREDIQWRIARRIEVVAVPLHDKSQSRTPCATGRCRLSTWQTTTISDTYALTSTLSNTYTTPPSKHAQLQPTLKTSKPVSVTLRHRPLLQPLVNRLYRMLPNPLSRIPFSHLLITHTLVFVSSLPNSISSTSNLAL